MHNIPVFAMIVGLPGSGKSYFVDHYFTKNLHIHSSDKIREEVLKDVNNQKHNAKVFDILNHRVHTDLSNGLSCVDDATNIERRYRLNLIADIAEIECIKNVYVMTTDIEMCFARNNIRERHVPESSILRMAIRFQIPDYSEGWTNIYLVDEDLNVLRVPEYLQSPTPTYSFSTNYRGKE